MGIINCDELRHAFHQPGDKGDVAGEPVKLGDHQHRPLAAAQVERGRQLRPVILPAAFNLCELRQQITPASNEASNSQALRVEAEAALPLAGGGNAVIGDERKHADNVTR